MFYQTPANLLVSFFALKHASALPSGPISVPQSTNVLSLLTRGVPANTIAGTGGCDNDPSYAQGTSRWKDGDGVSLGHDCDNGLWNGDAFWHCWTDWFDMGTQAYFADWQTTGNALDCNSTQSCNNVQANIAQQCSQIGWSVGGSVAQSFEYKIGVVTGTTQATVQGEANGNKQFCSTVTDTSTCTWNDQGCHGIWASPRKVTSFGYMRRSCNSPRDGTNIPRDQQIQRADGYYTVGMQDYQFDLPTADIIIGCGASCTDTVYPDPLPPGDATVTPPQPTG